MAVDIVQHSFGSPGSGGPVVALQRLLENSTREFGVISQLEPANGINVQLIKRFRQELIAYRPLLVHVRGLGNEGFHAAVAAKLAGVPKILVSIHGTHRDLKSPQNYWKNWIVRSILEPATLRLATHVATVCEFAAERDFLTPFGHKFAGVVPNGVEISPPGDTRLAVRKALNIPLDLPLALCVSRITLEKGYGVLAEALGLLDRRGVRFSIVIVGGGDESGEIRALFYGLKNIAVTFVGHQSNVAQFFAASDFFVFPSLHENLSNALIEALSFGLPAVATAVGGNVEVIKKGGGLLIPPLDAKELSAAIKEFIENSTLRNAYSREARQNISENYSVKRMVSRWHEVYDEILGGKS